MSQQPKIFKKNFIDLDFTGASITITDATATNTGQAFVDFLRNRNNISGWATTGSNDAANTELLVDLGSEIDVDHIILIGHNFDSYTIQTSTDNVSYTDLFPVISESSLTATTTEHSFTKVAARYFKIIITGTKTPNSDKFLNQLIITRKIRAGQFIGWPSFTSVTLSADKKNSNTLSGKNYVKETTLSYKATLDFKSWPENAQADLDIVDDMFFNEKLGFLFWPCGGDEDQFRSARPGFRLKDIYLCKVANEYEIRYTENVYKLGQNITLRIVEVI